MGLLLINSMNFIYASNYTEHYEDKMLTMKQNLSDNFINNDTKLKDIEKNDSSAYAKKMMNNTKSKYINYNLDNLSYNETDNHEPSIKCKSTKPNNQLQLNNSESKLFNTANTPQVKRLSLGLSASYYSNPITINNNTKQQKLEEYLNKHNDILPVIIIQADGLQVLDSVVQLMAFNDLYKINNFGTSPYI